MRVRVNQRVEDANRFAPGDPLTARQPFSVGHRVTADGVVIRVDKLAPDLGAVDLPVVQAEKLIRLGVAEAA